MLDQMKDTALAGDLFSRQFLPRLRQKADVVVVAESIPAFADDVTKLMQILSRTLREERQQAVFIHLCRTHLDDEIRQMSIHLAQRQQQNWQRVNGDLAETQLDQVRRWPLEDHHFLRCAGRGVAFIADQSKHKGNSTEQCEADQARFLSRLLAARLEALVGRNIQAAIRVLEQFESWLEESQVESIRQLVRRTERLVRAGILADAIAQWGHHDQWLEHVEHVAAAEADHDDELVNLLTEAVTVRRDHRLMAEENQQRADRNRLLRAILEQDCPSPETLLAHNSELAGLWHRATVETVAGLAELMRLNRLHRRPSPHPEAQMMLALATGMALQGHDGFERENLALRRWNSVPSSGRLMLLNLQDQWHQPGMRERLARNMDVLI